MCVIQSVVTSGCQNVDVLHFTWSCQNTAILQNRLIIFSDIYAKAGAALHAFCQNSGGLSSIATKVL